MSKPNTDQVIARAGALWALHWRLLFDHGWRTSPHVERDEIEQQAAALDGWIQEQQLSPSLAPSERELFRSLVGAWPEERTRDLWWRIERLTVLTWALGFFELLPAYDVQASTDLLEPIYGVLEPLAPLRERARLRSSTELRSAFDDAVRWRRRAAKAKRFFAHALGTAKLGPQPPKSNPDRIRKAIGGDVPIFGKLYSTINADEFSIVRSVSIERNSALRWLCEGGPWEPS